MESDLLDEYLPEVLDLKANQKQIYHKPTTIEESIKEEEKIMKDGNSNKLRNKIDKSSGDNNYKRIDGARGTKRKRNPEIWLSTIRKERRTAGQAYVSKHNKLIHERRLRSPCRETCKLKCTEKFSDDDRHKIFAQFWSKNIDINHKRQFVASCIAMEKIQRRRENTAQKVFKRNTTLHYYFLKNNVSLRVCKIFFLHTLDISPTFVTTALSKRSSEGGMVIEDQRGRKTPGNKISDEIKNLIREHILIFPTIASRCKKKNKSEKKFLPSELNINKMYKLYIDYCHTKNLPENKIAKLWLYTEIFNKEFNYSFEKSSTTMKN